jgi:hypothetical protein
MNPAQVRGRASGVSGQLAQARFVAVEIQQPVNHERSLLFQAVGDGLALGLMILDAPGKFPIENIIRHF